MRPSRRAMVAIMMSARLSEMGLLTDTRGVALRRESQHHAPHLRIADCRSGLLVVGQASTARAQSSYGYDSYNYGNYQPSMTYYYNSAATPGSTPTRANGMGAEWIQRVSGAPGPSPSTWRVAALWHDVRAWRVSLPWTRESGAAARSSAPLRRRPRPRCNPPGAGPPQAALPPPLTAPPVPDPRGVDQVQSGGKPVSETGRAYIGI